MKRTIALITVVFLLTSLFGCKQTGSVREPKEPVNFYYCNRADEHSHTEALISPELREALGHTNDHEYLLSLYLNGPLSYQYVSPFPRGVALHAFSFDNGVADITLSNQITQLTDFDATLAFACLTLTVKDLTGADSITIRAKDGLINDSASITLSPDLFAYPVT